MKRALFIGINYIGTDSELHGCINDVKNMKAFLKRAGYTDYRTLTEETANHKPTYANILKYMAWLVDGVKAGDQLFLHYSGHGSWEKDTDGDEDDGRDELLVPLDYDTAGMISDDILRKQLVEKIPAGVQLVCVFDCCHSGTILDLRYKYLSTTTFMGGKPGKPASKKDTQKGGSLGEVISYIAGQWSQQIAYTEQPNYPETAGQVILISGCKDTQTSADAYIAEDKENAGALTWAFLKVMRDHQVYPSTKSIARYQKRQAKLAKNFEKAQTGGAVTAPPAGDSTATIPPNGGDATIPPNGGDATIPPNGGDATIPPNTIKYKDLVKDVRCLLKVRRYTQIPQLTTGKYVDINSTLCL